MNNSSFTQIDNQTKAMNLVDVLDKRCRGFLKRDVIMSVVNRLDIKRQLVIEVVNEAVFTQQVKARTTYCYNNGNIENVQVQWVRCLLGSVDVGKDIVESCDGIETKQISVPTKIITYPTIALLEEQNLGNANPISSRLLIYI